jgi:ribosomal protein S18 acetylase RimI-like enzyme
MPTVSVRPFEPDDRREIRELCHRVGYMGEPATFYWSHKESFSEIWTAYYTDHEPESLFVAVCEDQVVGFLTGCVDTRAATSPAKAVTRGAVRNALFLRPGTAGFLWRGLLDTVVQRGTPSGELDDPRWPSHLHINLAPEARGCGAGRSLMEAWFKRLTQVGSAGCHLGTLFENARAIRFFERMGFQRYGEPQLAPGMRSPTGGRHHLQLMVRSTPAAQQGVADGPATARFN